MCIRDRHRTSEQLSNQNINFNFPNKTIASLAKVFPIAEKTNNTLNKLSDSWSFWSEGSVSFGRTGDTSSSASKDINSNGITIGMDKKISKNNILVIEFNNKGLVKNKKLVNLNDMNDLKYVKKITTKEFEQDNTIYNIFSSLREKVNAPARNRTNKD